jgi:5-(carboxyamino)imidazole ribonucleotide synthase
VKIGIIGAGQLGRMLALAGYPLGVRFVFLDHSADAPGGQVGQIICGEFADPERLAELAARVDLLTFDVENVPAATVRAVAQRTPLLPPPAALEAGQDRLNEKRLFAELAIPAPDYRTVDSLAELQCAVEQLGLPAVLKARRLGYDGRGQQVLKRGADVAPAWARLGGVPLILERFVAFERELSIIAVRSRSGEIAHYPLTENRHVDGILVCSRAPYEDAALQATARDYLQRLLEHFDYAGVLTLEMFHAGGRLLANEIAPRVHNSGHWTIEGAITSQFENHVRAILGWPLGDARALGHAAMLNLIGELPPVAAILGIAGAHYHDYGKTPRPGRKLGHCTVVAPTPEQRDRALDAVQACVNGGTRPT